MIYRVEQKLGDGSWEPIPFTLTDDKVEAETKCLELERRREELLRDGIPVRNRTEAEHAMDRITTLKATQYRVAFSDVDWKPHELWA